MLTKLQKPLNDIQREKLSQYRSPQCVDIHCHCLAGFDDGPVDIQQSIDLCEQLVKEGVTTVIATPHQLGRFEGYYDVIEITNAVEVLNKELSLQDIPLTVYPGAEVRVDERIIRLLQHHEIVTLADRNKYLLLELPPEIFIDLTRLLQCVYSLGLRVVLAHPERHRILGEHPEKVLEWARYGTIYQITANSLTGDMGISCERTAWTFLEMDVPIVIATDAHNTGPRRPCLAKAFDLLAHHFDTTTARRLCIENAISILNGQRVGNRDEIDLYRKRIQSAGRSITFRQETAHRAI